MDLIQQFTAKVSAPIKCRHCGARDGEPHHDDCLPELEPATIGLRDRYLRVELFHEPDDDNTFIDDAIDSEIRTLAAGGGKV